MLNQDFKEFIQFLNANQVRYLVVGGYAVAFYGYPRYTKDIDIWIEASGENAMNVMQSLTDFGFGSLDLTVEDFAVANQVIQLGYPPSRIDLLTSVDGIQFEDCYGLRATVEIDGVSVNFIDLENLRLNKRASGRFQDLADLENLSD
jgi:predicted nucleotidyltransferase